MLPSRESQYNIYTSKSFNRFRLCAICKLFGSHVTIKPIHIGYTLGKSALWWNVDCKHNRIVMYQQCSPGFRFHETNAHLPEVARKIFKCLVWAYIMSIYIYDIKPLSPHTFFTNFICLGFVCACIVCSRKAEMLRWKVERAQYFSRSTDFQLAHETRKLLRKIDPKYTWPIASKSYWEKSKST